MVKFGQTIEESQRPEWAAGYVNYKALKKMLSQMDAAGTTHEFSEHTVYKAISVASASNPLAPHAPREIDFVRKIDAEINKVNSFADSLHNQLLERFQLVREEYDSWRQAGSDEQRLVELEARMRDCSADLQRFEDFINLNYLAFSKILKKHDKLSSCPCRAPYLLRIQQEVRHLLHPTQCVIPPP